MDWMEILYTVLESGLFLLLLIIMLIGVGVSAINSIGTWIIWIAMLIGALIEGFDRIEASLIIIFFFVTLASTLIDNATLFVGARKMGAGKWGIVGAFVGSFIGLIVGNVVGAIIGPFIGAFLFEMLFENKDTRDALKAGLGTFIGFVAAVALKFGVGIAMIVIWSAAWFD